MKTSLKRLFFTAFVIVGMAHAVLAETLVSINVSTASIALQTRCGLVYNKFSFQNFKLLLKNHGIKQADIDYSVGLRQKAYDKASNEGKKRFCADALRSARFHNLIQIPELTEKEKASIEFFAMALGAEEPCFLTYDKEVIADYTRRLTQMLGPRTSDYLAIQTKKVSEMYESTGLFSELSCQRVERMGKKYGWIHK